MYAHNPFHSEKSTNTTRPYLVLRPSDVTANKKHIDQMCTGTCHGKRTHTSVRNLLLQRCSSHIEPLLWDQPLPARDYLPELLLYRYTNLNSTQTLKTYAQSKGCGFEIGRGSANEHSTRGLLSGALCLQGRPQPAGDQLQQCEAADCGPRRPDHRARIHPPPLRL